jgi:hypothetical protein
METTEKIVESYVRYIKGWATIPNIKCPGQYEIDLLAIDPVNGDRYHIESGISISGGHKNLTAKPFSSDKLKERLKQPQQRRTLDYFAKRKFAASEVVKTLARYGFRRGNYTKIIVTWGCEDKALKEAKRQGILIWLLPKLLDDIALKLKDLKTYFIDDTLRTLHLYQKAIAIYRKKK